MLSQTRTLVSLYFASGLVVGLVISFFGTNMTFLSTTTLRGAYQRSPATPSSEVLVLQEQLQQMMRMLNESLRQKNETSIPAQHPPLSHKEVDRIAGPKEPIKFQDAHMHKDSDRVAKDLYNKVRVLIWVMTSPENLDRKARHVKATWGHHANILLFMSSKEDKNFPAVGIEVEEGRSHLTMKTMKAFKYVYDNYLDKADWFMKVDDDSFVIVENLRYFLSNVNTSEPVFFGHHFKVIVNQGYYSGGGGYVLSKEALKRFANRHMECRRDGGAEDAEMGHCMEKLGVRTADSRDVLGRSRFHCFNPETHLHGGYPDWYRQYDKYGAQQGMGSISDYPITFHYVDPKQMYALEFYTYHLRPYGIENGLQQLNKNSTIVKS